MAPLLASSSSCCMLLSERDQRDAVNERAHGVENSLFHEVGKLYRCSDTVSRMTVYILIVERIC